MAQFVAIALSAVSALSQYRQGQAIEAQYKGQAQGLEVQAQYENLKARQTALQSRTEANNQLRAILENLARTTAVAGAGNVDPFTGSAEGVKKKILDVGGRNVITATENARMHVLAGQFQASQLTFQANQLRFAGREVRRQATTSAMLTMAAAGFNFYQAGGMNSMSSFFNTSPTGGTSYQAGGLSFSQMSGGF